MLLVPLVVGAQDDMRPSTLPATAVKILADSLNAARAYKSQPWRDTPPTNGNGTVNGYIEIARGDRRKWEFDMRTNRRAIDRMIPASNRRLPGELRLRAADRLATTAIRSMCLYWARRFRPATSYAASRSE